MKANYGADSILGDFNWDEGSFTSLPTTNTGDYFMYNQVIRKYRFVPIGVETVEVFVQRFNDIHNMAIVPYRAILDKMVSGKNMFGHSITIETEKNDTFTPTTSFTDKVEKDTTTNYTRNLADGSTTNERAAQIQKVSGEQTGKTETRFHDGNTLTRTQTGTDTRIVKDGGTHTYDDYSVEAFDRYFSEDILAPYLDAFYPLFDNIMEIFV